MRYVDKIEKPMKKTDCSSVVHERYVLSRHKDGVAVKRPDSLDNVTLASLPLLVITEKIGSGTCGTVYLATARGKQQIAVKIAMVAAGNTHCLAEELAAYECVRRVGLEGKATPRCFGLFSSKDMAVLLTAYSGQALASFELPIEDKLSIFRTVKSLEDAGIEQGSFYPRNVVRDDNGVFRIIDFHRGTYEKGRTIDASEMRGIHWQLEHRGNVYSHLILDWMHVIPLPETDDSALQEGYQLAVEEEVCGADQDRQIQHEG
ncbi:hypothetical protein CALCODRAFT_507023 [Calocera cornea HHB12733]|uniref:Protein kinase domain-containing protein n=1 Tax=Calocera cornea HHB12733 TaxID=1353952 RepID=A0A165I6E3_9BASI|nr:hypothetical protein CALCODRAFT_507023 [Calocera cornea HHB12733]